MKYESFVLRKVRGFYRDGLTPAGRWFFWPSVVFFGYSLVSVKVQIFLPLIYAGILWTLSVAAASLWRPRVRLRASHAERIVAGEVLPIEVEVEQVGRLAGHDLHVRAAGLPRGLRGVPEEGVALPELRRGQNAKARVEIACTQRGVYRWPGLRVETDFPFGLGRRYQAFPAERPILVVPRFTPLARLEIPTGRRYQPGGVALASVVGDSAEYIGNREFRDGDNVRDIDWRATARLQKPIVREYREEYFLRVAVILDTQVPRKAPAARRQDFERAVSACASVGDWLARQEYVVDLFAAGPNLYHLTAGRSLAYLDQILDILACVEDGPDEPFGVIEPELMENLARISAVVCVFLDWTETRRAFADRLKRQGVGVKALVVRGASCTQDPAADADWLGHVPVLDGAADLGAIEDL